MIDVVAKLKLILSRLGIRAAESDTRECRLKLGGIQEILSKKKRSAFTARGKFLNDESSLKWAKGKGDFLVSYGTESNPHIVISGMSGFGKSTLFKSLLSQIIGNELSCLIFDAHNEHCDIVRGLNGKVHNAMYSGINILELDGASVLERISELTRLFKEIYSLGYIQSTKLSECLWYTYRKAGARNRSDRQLHNVPRISDLLDELNIFIRNSKSHSESNTLVHLKERISLLNSSAFSGSEIDMKGILKGLNSFSIANIKSKEAKLIYIGELLARLYAMMHDGNKSTLRLYVMIDEAQFLIDNSDNNSIISKLIEEGRKYGIGVIIVTHAATTLNRKIIANSSVFLSFYAREPSEVSYISKIFSGGGPSNDIIKERIKYLKQNEAMVISNSSRMPIIISTPRFDQIKAQENAKKEFGEEEAKGFLGTMAKRPIALQALRNTLGISDSTIRKLILSKYIDSYQMPSSREEWMMLHNPSLSIEHEVWVTKISDILTSNGMPNRIIDNSKGPDIAATINGRRIAIEYETGSKSMESTLKMLESRMKEYHKIIIVTRDSLVEYYKRNIPNQMIEIIGHSKSIELPRLLA